MQVGEVELAVPEVRHPDEGVLAARRPQPGVEPHLDVDVVVRRPRLLDHVDGRAVGPQVLADQLGEGDPVCLAGRADDPPLGAAYQLAHVRELQPDLAVAPRPESRLRPGPDRTPCSNVTRRPLVVDEGNLPAVRPQRDPP